MQVEPTCDCDVIDVIFECGNISGNSEDSGGVASNISVSSGSDSGGIIVTTVLRVADDVDVEQLRVAFQTRAALNELAPFNVLPSSITLRFTSDGRCITLSLTAPRYFLRSNVSCTKEVK